MQSFILIVFIVFSDQLSKILIKLNLVKYEKVDILGNFLKFTYVENQGIAFGIDTSRFHVIVILLTIIAIFALIYYKIHSSLKYERMPLELIIGVPPINPLFLLNTISHLF